MMKDMYLESIIELIIGLLFTWYILSLATMQIQEWLASRQRWRANELKSAIRRMLNDRVLTQVFYEHPIIKSMSGMRHSGKLIPSYIPANQFSNVLVSMLLSAGHEAFLVRYSLLELSEKLSKIKDRRKQQNALQTHERLVELSFLPDTTIQSENTAFQGLIIATIEKELDAFAEHYPEIESDIEVIREKIKLTKERIDKQIESIKIAGKPGGKKVPALLSGMVTLSAISPDISRLLNSLLIGVDDNSNELTIERLQSNLEQWFNDSMDRLSGWYKRRAQLSVFSIGLIIALVFNVDSLELSGRLWLEPAVRQSLRANANLAVQNNPASESEIYNENQISIIQIIQNEYYAIPVGWKFTETALQIGVECLWVSRTHGDFGIQIGSTCYRPSLLLGMANGWVWLFIKTLGLLTTALACAQGSSFWFDILQKIINVRLSGIKPVPFDTSRG
ncbi:MAG: hypothetical protein QY332_12030 [Anaerolineales bacterium]|nr:MAG: hypothetical protein QY332_12030 [Anaerolineales bacterium]